MVSLLIVLFLVVSLVPAHVGAAGNGLKEAKLLTPGETVSFKTGTDSVNTYWYKMERGNTTSMTHMDISFEASAMANIAVYPSADMAAKDETFDRYRASSSPEESRPTNVQLPYAWAGPYYIKVEYMPMDIGLEEPSEEEFVPAAADIKLSYKPVKLPVKYEEVGGEMCPVEAILPEQDSLLKLIRRLQKEVIEQSGEGRKLSALYYRASPYVVKSLAFDKTKRQTAYADLKTLEPLITALVGQKNYTLTNQDAAAIKRMHALVLESVPNALKSEVNAVASTVGMSSLAGTPVVDLFGKVGMSIQATDTPRYIVKYKSTPTQSLGKMNAMRNVSAESIDIGGSGDHFALVDVEAASTKMQATAKSTLEADKNVEYIEPVQTYKSLTTDASYDYQWSINAKSLLKPLPGAGVGLDSYEALKLPGRTVKVAVLDTGVDYRLLDLKGKVDIANGKDFTDENGDGDALDDNGHGTHVAGVIGAIRDNGISMRGMVPNVSILPVKVLDASGSGDTDQIALGIKHAVDAGAKVINMSLGGGESRTIGFMLKYAHDRGVVVVAATGNDGDSEVSYPGSSKYTISVGATNTFGLVTDYSNYGIAVDVVAPGSKVASLVPDGNVVYMDGTSMATPHVAGVVALLKSQHPRMTVEGVRSILRRSADTIAFSGGDAIKTPLNEEELEYLMDELPAPPLPYFDFLSGYGKVNVYRAESMMQIAPKPSRIFDNAPVVNVQAKNGTTVAVYKGSKKIGNGVVRNGKTTFSILPQKEGTVLRVTYTNGKLATGEYLVVAKGARPKQPSVQAIKANAKQVTGKAQAGMSVVVRDSKKKVIGKSKVTINGAYVVKTRALKKGERVSVHAVDVTGKVSTITNVVVR